MDKFYSKFHAANAFLIFDNGSGRYSFQDLLNSIELPKNVDILGVVNWPFKFGPQAVDHPYWDSDFCQYGALETARRRFLAKSRAVLSVDIDELVINELDSETIFDATANVDAESLSFTGFGYNFLKTITTESQLITENSTSLTLLHHNVPQNTSITPLN